MPPAAWSTLICYRLVFMFSYLSVMEALQMDFFHKTSRLVATGFIFTLTAGWIGGLILFDYVFIHQKTNPRAVRLFRGCGGFRNSTGAAVVFLGNIIVYHSSEKSGACLLAFFFLACSWYCALYCLQPCTDFGVLDFLLGACLDVALNLFGVGFYTSLVSLACIAIIVLRYFLDPMPPPEQPVIQEPIVAVADLFPFLYGHSPVARSYLCLVGIVVGGSLAVVLSLLGLAICVWPVLLISFVAHIAAIAVSRTPNTQEEKKNGSLTFTRQTLNNICSRRNWPMPLYRCVHEGGPAHAKRFTYAVRVNTTDRGWTDECVGEAMPSVKKAKDSAALLLLQLLNKQYA